MKESFKSGFEKAAKIKDKEFSKIIHNISRTLFGKQGGKSRRGFSKLKAMRIFK